MSVMGDLEDAIENVIGSAIKTVDNSYVIEVEEMYELQEQFNLHFREPEDEQLSVIPCPKNRGE